MREILLEVESFFEPAVDFFKDLWRPVREFLLRSMDEQTMHILIVMVLIVIALFIFLAFANRDSN